MLLLPHLPYLGKVIFAALRISFWFILLFGFLGPLFLHHTKNLSGIEKLIYSWVGLGGLIIFSVFALTVSHIYDPISLACTLLLIPLIRNLWKSDKSFLEFFRHFEIEAIISHVKLIEKFKHLTRAKLKRSLGLKWKATGFELSETVLVIGIALFGGVTRMYPSLLNAAPLSRNWFFKLNRVKDLRLQNYFSGYPAPSGMHALVSVFSILTQVSPEMILHILGALTSFFLCILIYWSVVDLTKNAFPTAAMFAMALYAITPMLLMPLSIDLQVEANSIDLALCFAIPTITFFMRNIRSKRHSPWFYVLAGFIATGMTNLFVCFIILLPLLVLGLLSLIWGRQFSLMKKAGGYLLASCFVVLVPIIIYNWLHNISQYQFLLDQLFSVRSYSFAPDLLMSLENISVLYLFIAAALLLGYMIEYFAKMKSGFRDEGIFLIVFISVALIYSPFVRNISSWLDGSQLMEFYSILIALLGGILFSSVLRWTNKIIRLHKNTMEKSGIVLLVFAFSGFIYLQGGIRLSQQFPSTVPNGFYKSYYSIINNYLPYSYATVAPQIENTDAKDRHYFMNYKYFLKNYGKIDSTYHKRLHASTLSEKPRTVPPASIFIFVEKPPYNGIQKGVLDHASSVMNNIKQWLAAYRKKPGRDMKIYYQDKNTIVYQIVNRKNDSKVGNILTHIYSKKNDNE